MHQTEQIIQVMSGIVVLLLIAAVFRWITARLKLPFTVVLVLAGIGLGLIAARHPSIMPAWRDLELSPALILYVFLPSLIFESAFNLDAKELRQNLAPVLLLAVPGLLISTAVIGLLVHAAASVPLGPALLLGAILSATDPVAVLAIFRRLGAPARLRLLVEGESLFNDATSLVLARLVLAAVLAGAFSRRAILSGFVSFLVVFVGGIAVGWILGVAAGFVIGKVQDNFIEITLTTVLAYASFVLAERALHVSGIMATIGAGLAVGGWRRVKISAAVRAYLEHFWEYMASIANALIFLMVGLRVDLGALAQNAGLLVWVVIAMLVSRAVVVYGLMPLAGRLPRSSPVGKAYRTVIFWGGLRGAIAIAIVLSLPAFNQRESFIAVVMGAVVFSLVASGLTIEPLLRKLGLDRPPAADLLVRMEADFTANREALGKLPGLFDTGLSSSVVSASLMRQLEDRLSEIRSGIERLHKAELGDDQHQKQLLYLRALIEERSVYVRLLDTGQIGERAFRSLIGELDMRLNNLAGAADLAEALPSAPGQIVGSRTVRYLAPLARLNSFMGRFQRQQLASGYDIASGRYHGAQTVLGVIDELARVEQTPWYIVDLVRRRYEQTRDAARRETDLIAEQYPERVRQIQQRAGHRLVLAARAESIARQLACGLLAPELAERLLRELARELRASRLREKPVSKAKLKLSPLELLRVWTPLAGLTEEDLAVVAATVNAESAREGRVIFRQGESAQGIYFIAHGVVRLSVEKNGRALDRATLIAGDSFGEREVLAGLPCETTAAAATLCSLYRLDKRDLEVAMAANPRVQAALAEPLTG